MSRAGIWNSKSSWSERFYVRSLFLGLYRGSRAFWSRAVPLTRPKKKQNAGPDSEFFRIGLRANKFHILEQYLAMSLEKTESMLKERFLNVSDMQARWASHYGGYGCMGVIQCWIEDGLRQPPEEVADFIVDTLTKTMG